MDSRAGVGDSSGARKTARAEARGSVKRARFETRRRGSLYVMVLGTAVFVAIVGLSALMVVRVERRSLSGLSDFAQAHLHARSAVEIGLHRIESDPNWRVNNPEGYWRLNQPIGAGRYSLYVEDDTGDGNLADDELEPIVFTATGVQGEARHMLAVSLSAVTAPLEALRTAAHADSVTIKGGKFLTGTGAPISANGLLTVEGGAVLTGDVEAAALSNGGTISGTITVPAPPKDMPDPDVINTYLARATPIPVTGDLNNIVLSPGYNPWGAPNPDGVYSVSLSGALWTLRDSRIHGTLVVQNPGGRTTVDGSVLLHGFRSDYPVLIVVGDLELAFSGSGNNLNESALATNFNPSGAEYMGVSDDDQIDAYPSEISGLVHVTGALVLADTALVRGAILCESDAFFDGNNEIVHDPNLYANPPQGYTMPPEMRITQGSWRQVVDTP